MECLKFSGEENTLVNADYGRNVLCVAYESVQKMRKYENAKKMFTWQCGDYISRICLRMYCEPKI